MKRVDLLIHLEDSREKAIVGSNSRVKFGRHNNIERSQQVQSK